MAHRKPLSLTHVALASALLGAAACSDVTSVPSAPVGPRAALSNGDLSSKVLSQTRVGDTTVTVFQVGTAGTDAKNFSLGGGSQIVFPYQAGSICTLATSGYGPGTWDQPCAPSATPVKVTARTWFDAKGLPHSDFQPAMRFVPGLAQSVTLYLHTLNGAPSPDGTAVYCTDAGTCVDESLTDRSLVTTIDPTNGFWIRKIKHFSGYNITYGFTGDPSGGYARAVPSAPALNSGYITTTGLTVGGSAPEAGAPDAR